MAATVPEGVAKTTLGKGVLTKLLVGLTLFFGVVTLALVGYIIYKEVIYKESLTRENLIRRFPGYYWTHEEFLWYSRLLNSSMKDVTKLKYFEKPCNADCPSQPWYRSNRRRRREVGVVASSEIYHGCCMSQLFYMAPLQQPNQHGTLRTLFHLLPDAQQFFKVSWCYEHYECTGCSCMYEEEMYSAVVVKAGVTVADATLDDLEIDVLVFNGCCKCVNDGS
uniref:Uncharacterized protein LOC111124112 n=1 Tax=Crassostrea virginica TaxID=6565 RepID=A0A8B8D3L8_CRAVI|nr:uncharacterized protein LOC111124112 [Crassostrea virginica]